MKGLKFEIPTAVLEVGREGNQGTFKIRPLERGYGTTIGNAIRRVLLSSLPGAAIINVTIDGVEHEFSTINGVYEDVMGIVLNLKKIIISFDDYEDAFTNEDAEFVLSLNAVGPCEVTAAYFSTVTGIKIINTNQTIATLSEGGNLSMTVTVRRGSGYVSADRNKEYSQGMVGTIAIDSIYTPIEKVSYSVEKSRGDMDELILSVTTNGAITAKDAIAIASKMLVNYFDVIAEISEKAQQSDFIQRIVEQPIIEKEDDRRIEELELPPRALNALKRENIFSVSELSDLTSEQVMRLRSVGLKTFREIKAKMSEHGYSFKESTEDINMDSIDEKELEDEL